jgi:formate C-acetyltransferase
MKSFRDDVPPEKNYTIEDLVDLILRDKEYYILSGGGVTFSGGEPFLQDPECLIRLLKLLKEEYIHIAVETSLHVPWDHINKLEPYIDLYLVDLKVVGDDHLHIKYTNQDSRLIHSNLKKLLDRNANVKFRMVMVPGFNDGEDNIKSTAHLLKSLNYDSLELLKYHNFYEDKARRLGLNYQSLGITNEKATESIERGIKLFEKQGINVKYVERDATLKKTSFSPRVRQIQKDIRNSGRALCIEACKLKTKYYKKNGFEEPTPIHRAECLSYVLRNKTVRIYPKELLVGNFTSKRCAGQLWEEYYGPIVASFLYKIDRLKPVRFQCSFKEKLYSYVRLFPFWMKHSLFNIVYSKILDVVSALANASETVAGFNNNMASIAHFIVNFERTLELGTSGLIKKLKKKKAEKSEKYEDFYDGAIISLKALEAFAARYSKELTYLSQHESNRQRKKELKKMAEICEHVPKNPARTFHEALQSMLFLHIALCTESYENAISFGRLDQILSPYYKRDKEEGRITYEEAKELLCLFILKMDEVILVNDGDSFPSLNGLFETLSTDQAVTFGGVDKDGKDATNDVTYMLIDACELQPLSADMAARINKNSPEEYLEKISEVYIKGCPIPQLFSDEIYIETIIKHYPVSIESARNYSIVGCVEPNASDDHFGNTDCANVNLTLPLLQALKGQEHDLWNNKTSEDLLTLITNFVIFYLRGKNLVSRFILRICNRLRERRKIKLGLYNYNPPSNMEELLERFQKRLNHLTNSILKDHQKIERHLRQHFPTPLASSLSKGCIESGRDVYEGGATINSSGIQAVGVTDVADSLFAINEVVFKKKLYSIEDVIVAIENNFQGSRSQKIRSALLSVPKFGEESSTETIVWMNEVLKMYNNALDSVGNSPRDGRYSAGYYALNVCTRYGKNTPALPSGRLEGEPLANSLTPHYGMEQSDLLSSLNSIAGINFIEHAENGSTATLTIDSSLFQNSEGKKNLASLINTFLSKGGMQLQPNVVNREMLQDAYEHPEKYPNLMVRIAGYCAYFNELSDGMKQVIINRACYK